MPLTIEETVGYCLQSFATKVTIGNGGWIKLPGTTARLRSGGRRAGVPENAQDELSCDSLYLWARYTGDRCQGRGAPPGRPRGCSAARPPLPRGRRRDVGIIILTGRGDVIDRVAGLEVGADDYLTKPFHPREVLARVRSVLRRTRAAPRTESGGEEPAEADYRFEGWEVEARK